MTNRQEKRLYAKAMRAWVLTFRPRARFVKFDAIRRSRPGVAAEFKRMVSEAGYGIDDVVFYEDHDGLSVSLPPVADIEAALP